MAHKDKDEKSRQQIAGDAGRNNSLSVAEYVIMNLVFWAYCALQILVIKWLMHDVVGIYFFFAILAAAFSIVSVYDFFYDRIAQPEPSAASPASHHTASQE